MTAAHDFFRQLVADLDANVVTERDLADALKLREADALVMEGLGATVAILRADLRKSEGMVAALDAEITRLDAEIAALKTSVVDPPVVVATKVLLGISGKAVIDGSCQRWFSRVSAEVAPRRSVASCPRIHCSWKGLAPIPDATIISNFKNLLDGDKVEIEHEPDVDYRKAINAGYSQALAQSQLTARLAAKDRFYAQVVRLREAGLIPKVDVVNTLSSYTWELNDQERFYCHADVVGADLDGGNFPKDYGDADRLAKIVAFAVKYYSGRWTAPEFGWKDTVPGQRIPTILSMIPRIAAYKPEEIQFFDSTSFSPVLTVSELAEYKVLVDQYNR